MSEAMLAQLTEVKESIEKYATATLKVQEKNDSLEEKLDAIDVEILTKATEDATKALTTVDEIRTEMKEMERTSEHLEKVIARIGSGGDDSEAKENAAKAREEFSLYMRTKQAMTDDTVELIVRSLAQDAFLGVPAERKESEVKTLIAGNNPDGGYFIRPERSATMIKRIFETSPMRAHANIETTSSDSLEMVIDDDEATSGGWTGETSTRGETDTPEIGMLVIPAHEQFAQPKATQKMLDDAGFDLESWLGGKVTRKMTRTENTAFVSGDGSQKPRGFLSLSAWSVAGTYERNKLEQINSGVSAQFTGDGIKDLQNSLIEDYQANAIFVMKRASFQNIITLKDGTGAYLLDPRSLKAGDTKVLLGKEVVFMHDMQAIAADALAMAYGDFGVGYTIVDRIGFRVLRDAFTSKPFIKFYTTKRTGGDVTNYESIKIQKLAA